MGKIIVAVLLVVFFCFTAGQVLSKTMPHAEDHGKRLVIMQSIVSDIALSDLEKAAKDANMLGDMVSKDSASLTPGSMKDANINLENSIRAFNKALEKKDFLVIIGSYSDILGHCYGCHTKYRDSIRATHTK